MKKKKKTVPVKGPPRRKVVLKYPLSDDPELGGIGGFGTDPGDSKSLLRLREIIDQYIGWRTEDEEEAGDYEARLIEVGEDIGRVESKEREAEELRAGIEELVTDRDNKLRELVGLGLDLDDVVVKADDLRDLLDRVDARDSLAFVEKRAAKRSPTKKKKRHLRS